MVALLEKPLKKWGITLPINVRGVHIKIQVQGNKVIQAFPEIK